MELPSNAPGSRSQLRIGILYVPPVNVYVRPEALGYKLGPGMAERDYLLPPDTIRSIISLHEKYQLVRLMISPSIIDDFVPWSGWPQVRGLEGPDDHYLLCDVHESQ